jgi:hypothetical protein
VVESDSRDDTVEVLGALARERPRFRFVALGALAGRFPKRTERIAQCRNRYLAELEAQAAYSAVTHVLVADLDGTNDLLTSAALHSAFTRTDWDVCAANQRGRYYDIWALRHDLWSPNDCWAQYHFLVRLGLHPEAALRAAVHARMIRIPEHSDWIRVDSAFGGLALYRKEALLEGRYAGTLASGEEVCEHVALHAALAARGRRIFINPALINTGATEHTRALDFPQRWRRRLSRVKRALVRGTPRREAP